MQKPRFGGAFLICSIPIYAASNLLSLGSFRFFGHRGYSGLRPLQIYLASKKTENNLKSIQITQVACKLVLYKTPTA
jgi:hypothetical protein